MPKFPVEKSIQVNVTPAKAHEIVRDFKQWSIWSPWLIAEPDCPLEFANDGKSYSWEGTIVGSGNMEVTNEIPSKQIDYNLNFLKPFKTSNTTAFSFEEKDGGTLITWTMLGSLPFFMFFMKKMMSAWIGMDCDRGLKMLKDYLEKGKVESELSFESEYNYQGCHYIGIRRKCHISEIGEMMSKDFTRLESFFKAQNIEPASVPFSLYHKPNMVKGIFDYIAGIPLTDIPADIPSEFLSGNIPDGATYAVHHKGPYEHLGNAWAVGMMHGQAKKFKGNKKQLCFELYHNDPNEVEPQELQTSVHFPSL